MQKKFLVLGFLIVSTTASWLRADEPPKIRVTPSAYQLTWATNAPVYLAKFGLDHYEVFNEDGQSLWSHNAPINNVVLASDGTCVAYVVPNDGVYLYTFQSQQNQKLSGLQAGRTLTQLAWSPSGQKLVYWLFSDEDSVKPTAQLITLSLKK